MARAVDSRDWIELLDRRRAPPQLRRGAVPLRARPRRARARRGPRRARPTSSAGSRRSSSENPDGYLDDSNDGVRPLRHLHRRPLAVLRAARAAHRSAVARRAPATRSRSSTPWPDPTAPRSRGAAPPACSPPRSPSSSRRSRSATTCATTAPARGSGAASTRSAPPPPASTPTASPTRTATATRTRTAARPAGSSSRSTCSASSRGPVPRSAPRPPTDAADPRATYRRADRLVRFEADRAAGVWVHATPGRRVVIPFVGCHPQPLPPRPPRPGDVRGAGRQRPGGAGRRSSSAAAGAPPPASCPIGSRPAPGR